MDNKQKLFEYLRSQKVMSVATYGDDVWAATVFYVIEDDFSLYFMSEESTQHIQDLRKNKSIAATIADSCQGANDKKIGVQIKGIAEEIKGMDRMDPIMNMWHTLDPDVKSILNVNTIRGKVVNSVIFKITPQYIKLFSEELYGTEGYETFQFGESIQPNA